MTAPAARRRTLLARSRVWTPFVRQRNPTSADLSSCCMHGHGGTARSAAARRCRDVIAFWEHERLMAADGRGRSPAGPRLGEQRFPAEAPPKRSRAGTGDQSESMAPTWPRRGTTEQGGGGGGHEKRWSIRTRATGCGLCEDTCPESLRDERRSRAGEGGYGAAVGGSRLPRSGGGLPRRGHFDRGNSVGGDGEGS